MLVFPSKYLKPLETDSISDKIPYWLPRIVSCWDTKNNGGCRDGFFNDSTAGSRAVNLLDRRVQGLLAYLLFTKGERIYPMINFRHDKRTGTRTLGKSYTKAKGLSLK